MYGESKGKAGESKGKGWEEQRAHRRSGPDQGSGPMMVLSKIRKSESVGVLTDGF